jgi:hypothetical protein
VVLLLLAAACAPTDDSRDSVVLPPADIRDVQPPAEQEDDTDILVPFLSPMPALTLTLPTEGAAYFEVRAFDLESGTPWMGAALAVRDITSDATVLMLPRVPPRRDRAHSVDGNVVYAVALRAEAAGGRPGLYTGIAPQRLVYLQTDPPEGAALGWNLALRTEDGIRWAPLAVGLALENNLLGAESLDYGGDTSVGIEPGMHMDLATEDDVTAFDLPLAPEWSVGVPYAPPAEAYTEVEPLGSVLALYAYLDADGDNRRTGEEILGRACYAGYEARATWFDSPYDLLGALALENVGARAGWGVAIDTERGLVPLPDDAAERLVLMAACD